ncbi:MAG: winged helix-turn-helix domain-containing protein [Rickettsiales bacterium]|jgi:hypothetical protein|nr:winged helix-turn-helix domain-containing protein [Rickettsiales bacterium]
MNLLLFSGDTFLIDLIETRIASDLDISLGDINNPPTDITTHNIILFDCVGVDIINKILAGACLDGKFIINIGPDPVANATNIQPPFRVNSVLEKIMDFLSFSQENMLFCRSGVVNLNDNTFLGNNVIIRFTEMETELIRVVAKNKKINRKNLIASVWGPRTQNNRVLETMLYNIRKKLADAGIENFIEFSEGYYTIDSL